MKPPLDTIRCGQLAAASCEHDETRNRRYGHQLERSESRWRPIFLRGQGDIAERLSMTNADIGHLMLSDQDCRSARLRMRADDQISAAEHADDHLLINGKTDRRRRNSRRLDHLPTLFGVTPNEPTRTLLSLDPTAVERLSLLSTIKWEFGAGA